MLKRLVALCCSVILSTSFVIGTSTSAAVIPPDRPTYSYTSDCSSSLSISGSTATCESKLLGYSGTTTKIVVKQILQKNNSGRWEDICSWTHTSYTFFASVTNYKYSLTSGTYRLKSVFTVYSGSNYETITKYS